MIDEITTSELFELIQSGPLVTLVDARGEDYFLWERLPTAVNLRWRYAAERAQQVLPNKDALIVTYCDGYTCEASVKCYYTLRQLGYSRTKEYSGGITDWKAHGHGTTVDQNHRVGRTTYRFPRQEFYGAAVGCYLIDLPEDLVLIDGPQDLSEEHLDFILHFGKPLHIILTHDSTSGQADKLQKLHGAKIYLHQGDRDGEWLSVKPDALVDDGFALGSALTLLHTPGHTPGSVTIYHAEEKSLFTGDHLSGTPTGFLRPFDDRGSSRSNRSQWKASMRRLAELDVEQILPFHYDMIRKSAHEKIELFIKEEL